MTKKSMALICFLSAVLTSTMLGETASRPIPAGGSLTPASTSLSSVSNAPPSVVAPGRIPRQLPPEAFTVPTNYMLIVNHDGAVDAKWLEKECAYMGKQLRVSVRAENADGKIGSDAREFVKKIRAGHGDKAKIVIVVSKEAGLTPILTAPYENWVVMDAAWVVNGGGGAEKINDRMGKRIYQALGHCIGAGHRPEREAVMRYTPTPGALDDCLSHGFHPLNSNIFDTVQRGIGLDAIRMRPRKELIEEGILKPLAPKAGKPE